MSKVSFYVVSKSITEQTLQKRTVCGSLMHNFVLTNSRVPSDMPSFKWHTQGKSGEGGTVTRKGAAWRRRASFLKAVTLLKIMNEDDERFLTQYVYSLFWYGRRFEIGNSDDEIITNYWMHGAGFVLRSKFASPAFMVLYPLCSIQINTVFFCVMKIWHK
jgi:hypothetical protein